MNEKLKMLFHYDPYEMHLNILICKEEDGIITHVAKPVELVLEERKQFTSIEPTIRIGRGIDAKTLLKSIEEELPRLGVIPTPQAQLQGELTATKRHLEDVRALLFDATGLGHEKKESIDRLHAGQSAPENS